jgi:hypothetical protein
MSTSPTTLTSPTTVPPTTTTTTPPPVGFQIVTPDFEVLAGQEINVCYYFRSPNTQTIAVDGLSSTMPSILHDAVLYRTQNDREAPGSQLATVCDLSNASGQDLPRLLYIADAPATELLFPADDGTGKPLAMELPPNTPLFVSMHFVNATEAAATSRFTLNMHGLPAAAAYTRSEAFTTYNDNLSIPANSVGDVESQTCRVSAGLSFWRMTTRSHKQSVRARVLDGTATVVDGTNWEHPGVASERTPPFISFASDRLTFECTYDNPTGRTITSGASFENDEECMAIGYFFPAVQPVLCFNGFIVP